jgi:hypothetical protein
MKNWTDTCINWHQLTGTEAKRLIATWGMSERQIANYDAKHGYETKPKAHVSNTSNPVDFPKTPAKKTTTKAVAKAPAKKVVQKATRQKHTGADGEIKFVEHRNLYVGFMGGKVVVTKRTEAQCREFLATTYGAD